jgi:hypothetical protein
MEIINPLLEFLKYLIPAGFVCLAVFIILRYVKERDAGKDRFELKRDAMNTILPLRISAYERLVLYLERIHLPNLMLRIEPAGKNARMVQLQMLEEIRTEFEHNLIQQLYVSPDAWNALMQAKEETLVFINETASRLPDNAHGTDLCRLLLTGLQEKEQAPNALAILLLKRDIQKLFFRA